MPTWVKLIDDWYEHPKFLEVSPVAELLWLRSLGWSGHHRRDGQIPDKEVRRLAADLGVRNGALAHELVKAKLWHRRGRGYAVHDWDHYQRTRAQIEAESKAKARAGRLGGKQRAKQRA